MRNVFKISSLNLSSMKWKFVLLPCRPHTHYKAFTIFTFPSFPIFNTKGGDSHSFQVSRVTWLLKIKIYLVFIQQTIIPPKDKISLVTSFNQKTAEQTGLVWSASLMCMLLSLSSERDVKLSLWFLHFIQKNSSYHPIPIFQICSEDVTVFSYLKHLLGLKNRQRELKFRLEFYLIKNLIKNKGN